MRRAAVRADDGARIQDERAAKADDLAGHCGTERTTVATMDSRLQRRIQRYGWDLAATAYEPLWRSQLAVVQAHLIALAGLAPGERVLDVACGTGLVTLAAARAVGPRGSVLGVDLSGTMVDAARRQAHQASVSNATFARMDAETLDLPHAGFDVVLCALGLMYMPDWQLAVSEIHRVLRSGGRTVLAVWGERSRCGWSALFPIVDAEVASEVCPLFFSLGQQDTLARACAQAKFDVIACRRIEVTLNYADANQACDAAFVGGPVALAWSRFGAAVRARVLARYVEAIEPWRRHGGYEIPGEFVMVSAVAL
jgi:ubiquinone/menaquinone biosynthesis C-methylase UbiE